METDGTMKHIERLLKLSPEDVAAIRAEFEAYPAASMFEGCGGQLIRPLRWFTEGLDAHLTADHEALSPASIYTATNCGWMPNAAHYPKTAAIAQAIAGTFLATQLGIVGFITLKAGGRIKGHRDLGIYTKWYQRLYIPIVVPEGCEFFVGDEGDRDDYVLEPGDVITADFTKTHGSHNPHPTEHRQVLVIDFKHEPLPTPEYLAALGLVQTASGYARACELESEDK